MASTEYRNNLNMNRIFFSLIGEKEKTKGKEQKLNNFMLFLQIKFFSHFKRGYRCEQCNIISCCRNDIVKKDVSQ